MRTSIVLIAIAFIACQNTETAPPAGAAAADTATTSRSAAPPQPTQISQGLQTPESVLYDADQDVYFISNINGQPLAADNNGYISRVNAETLQIEEKWIDAGHNGVKLNAPKGLGIAGDTLYVADLTVVRMFDRKSGAPKGEVAIPGSTFLNDVATAGTNVYVSDSVLKAGAGGNFEPTGTDAIWNIAGKTPSKIASGSSLNRPNGITVVNGRVWAVSFGAKELYRIENGTKAAVSTLPSGSLDGLIHLDDGSFLVSSWDGKAVYRGNNNSFHAVVENINAPADIGYDTKRQRLLIPHFMDNVVSIHPLK
ncbi:MAG: hypothetical protein QOE68_4140 [Thermoanaerobaculia bacterium]|nr:hypothetical protein [Thermoanaerobaculia bacterium]